MLKRLFGPMNLIEYTLYTFGNLAGQGMYGKQKTRWLINGCENQMDRDREDIQDSSGTIEPEKTLSSEESGMERDERWTETLGVA